MASRSLTDLLPEARERFGQWLALCEAHGVDVLVYCTHRPPQEQAQLYASGRTAPGRIVTMARPWESWHQYRVAVDAVPLILGKPDWSYSDLDKDRQPDEPWWADMVGLAADCGVEWAGHWQRFTEYVHWQVTSGRTMDETLQRMVSLGYVV